MKVTDHTVEKLIDPTGILSGERYEFLLNLEVPEDDELFSENGIALRVIFAVDENGSRMSQYNFIEQVTNRALDFALDEDEEVEITKYCTQNI